ncbi:ATP-binding protein [Pseudonocardia acaciae]|uniref:ATP-binding protein n=1 Tax=Pseudonocardia acaciae TaxID=551276 RepID=UPI00048D6EDD|nr:AAA family ATPase [Pseudonocardia acaciae]
MSSPLIGREHPVGVLRAEVDHLLAGRGGLALVSGEAGIGKTTLVTEVAAAARRRGARVLNGVCWDGGGAPDYWPWVQVARNLARVAGTEEWARATEAAGDGLPALLGEPGSRRPASTDGAAFRLHDAFTNLLVTAARDHPVAVVLDDLHWADPASVRLLEFVVRHAAFEPILVIGTYRDVEIDTPEHPLRPLLAPLLPRATAVRLTGLDAEQVGALIARATGDAPDRALAAEVHRRTGGNPFFVEQTARLAGTGEPVAAGVRDAIERRLAPLPGPLLGLLRTAAVIGHEFDPALLGAAAATSPEEVERLLGLAVATGLASATRHGRYAFTHDLVREFLYGSLGDRQRRAAHAELVRALQAAGGAEATLAHHARLAVPELAEEKAVELLRAAATDALGRLAPEEATRHYRAALELTDPARRADRAAIELDLGTALDQAGGLTEAREAFEHVIATARELGDAPLLARAALGLHRLGDPAEDARAQINLMDEARARLDEAPERDDALSALLLAAASMARTHKAVDGKAARLLGERAVALAREHGDDDALGWALLAHHDAMWEPGTAEARVEVLDELGGAARRAHNRELEALASFLRTLAHLELGDPRALGEFATFERLTERTRLPRHRFLALSRRGALEVLAGRFAQARRYLDEASAFGERVGEVDRRMVLRDQVWALEMMRADYASAEAAAGSTPGQPFTDVLLALIPRPVTPELAARWLASVESRIAGLPARFRSILLVFRAHLAAVTGDDELCRRARADLEPVAHTWAVLSGGVILGPMNHWLGSVDRAQGRYDDAVARFTAAGASADRLGARPWSVLARARLADALAARGDAHAAAALVADAMREADELDMARAMDPYRHLASPSARAEEAPNAFSFDGQVWTLRYGGHTVHMRDAKGLRDLHTLLGAPGTDIPAVVLLDPGDDTRHTRHTRRLGADPVLDDQARAAYRDRLRRIDQELDDLLDRGDDHRAAALDQEREALLDELRRATGLAGRSRRLGDETERARQAVTARIRDTLRRLRKLHPELADHLTESVSTGTHCRYHPPAPVTWAR